MFTGRPRGVGGSAGMSALQRARFSRPCEAGGGGGLRTIETKGQRLFREYFEENYPSLAPQLANVVAREGTLLTASDWEAAPGIKIEQISPFGFRLTPPWGGSGNIYFVDPAKYRPSERMDAAAPASPTTPTSIRNPGAQQLMEELSNRGETILEASYFQKQLGTVGMSAIGDWFLFDWMKEAQGLGKAAAQGVSFNIYRVEEKYVLVAITREGGVGSAGLHDKYRMSLEVGKVVEREIRAPLKGLGVQDFRVSSSVLELPAESRIVIESARKMTSNPPALMDGFLEMLATRFVQEPKLVSPFPLSRAKELVGTRRNPHCLPFILWGLVHEAFGGELKPTDNPIEIYQTEVQPFFSNDPRAVGEAISKTFYSYQRDNATALLVAAAFLHHFLSVERLDPAVRRALEDSFRSHAIGKPSESLEEVYESPPLKRKVSTLREV